MSNSIQRLCVVGECMLEFCRIDGSNYQLGFAGDVFNMAYYFRLMSPTTQTVDIISAIGADKFSQHMLKRWNELGVQSRFVRHIKGRQPGLYMVETDEVGERRFIYYRNEAAARYMFNEDSGKALLNQLNDFDMVYFSGITLAILKEPGRELFIKKLSELRKLGVRICFDCNYREILWRSASEAAEYMQRVIPLADIVRPSFDDSSLLFGVETIDACVDYYLQLGAGKVVVTNGCEGYVIATLEHRQFYSVETCRAVDTTGAGDAFSGAYIAGVMSGLSDKESSRRAALLSAEVVQHAGAIVDQSLLTAANTSST